MAGAYHGCCRSEIFGGGALTTMIPNTSRALAELGRGFMVWIRRGNSRDELRYLSDRDLRDATGCAVREPEMELDQAWLFGALFIAVTGSMRRPELERAIRTLQMFIEHPRTSAAEARILQMTIDATTQSLADVDAEEQAPPLFTLIRGGAA